jgi:hypothetical protein
MQTRTLMQLWLKMSSHLQVFTRVSIDLKALAISIIVLLLSISTFLILAITLDKRHFRLIGHNIAIVIVFLQNISISLLLVVVVIILSSCCVVSRIVTSTTWILNLLHSRHTATSWLQILILIYVIIIITLHLLLLLLILQLLTQSIIICILKINQLFLTPSWWINIA